MLFIHKGHYVGDTEHAETANSSRLGILMEHLPLPKLFTGDSIINSESLGRAEYHVVPSIVEVD